MYSKHGRVLILVRLTIHNHVSGSLNLKVLQLKRNSHLLSVTLVRYHLEFLYVFNSDFAGKLHFINHSKMHNHVRVHRQPSPLDYVDYGDRVPVCVDVNEERSNGAKLISFRDKIPELTAV